MSRNMNCINNHSQEVQQYLVSLQAESIPLFIPALVLMALLIAVGSVGNCLVLIIYSTKLARTALRTFIISLSLFDLLINIYVIPGEIYDLLHVWDFDLPLVCKTRRYFNCALIVDSNLMLVAIAITRYKMVCGPPEKRVTITQAKAFCVIITSVALILSIPYFIINGTQKRKTPDPQICGYFCQLDESYTQTVLPMVNSLLFIAAYVICTTVLIVSYVCIGHKVWTHKVAWNKITHQRQDKPDPVSGEPVSENTSSAPESNRAMCTPGPALHSLRAHSLERDSQSASNHAKVQYRNNTRDENKLVMSCKRNKSNTISCLQKSRMNLENGAANHLSRCRYTNTREPKRNYSKYLEKRYNEQRKGFSGSWTILTTLSSAQPNKTSVEKQKSFLANTSIKRRNVFSKTSWMMATASFVSIVGFVPLLALNLYKTVAPESFASLEGLPLALFHIFFRSYLFNSAVNPILFIVCDKKFQRECMKLFKCSSKEK